MHIKDRHMPKAVLAIFALVAGLALLSWQYLPQQDPKAYFNFADRRMYLGIPRFWDVFSNLAFIYAGALGVLCCLFSRWLKRKRPIVFPFFFMNVSIILTGIGSSYFHLQPTPASLFWDRAPMAMGFMALLIMLLRDRTPMRIWSFLLIPAMTLGCWAAWQINEGAADLRYYIIVQFGALLVSLALVVIRKPYFISNGYLYGAFGFYVLAKVAEHFDHEVFAAFIFSGHTLKHFLAAVAIFILNIGACAPVRIK